MLLNAGHQPVRADIPLGALVNAQHGEVVFGAKGDYAVQQQRLLGVFVPAREGVVIRLG